MSRLWQGSGQLGHPETGVRSIKEYVFSVPRTIAGVPYQGAELKISIHRNGKIARIRSKGSFVSLPNLSNAISRKLSSADILKRAELDNPNADVRSLGLTYVPTVKPTFGAAVEPCELMVVFPPLEGVNGRGRGRRVCYSVTNAVLAPTALDSVLDNDYGDPK